MTTQLCLTTAHAARECDNATLLARMADGDQSAWRRLIDEYDVLVRSVAASFRLQTADVQDVAQTTWLHLLRNVRAIRDPERLAGWLAVTATRESLAVLRRSSRLLPLPTVDETPDATADPARDVADRAEARELWATVAELSPRQRGLLIALFRDELDSYNDVASTCAMPIGSIGPTRARALAVLRRKLADRGLGPTGS
jgi:RNA polymerase sigma factor (sigma-70 family)